MGCLSGQHDPLVDGGHSGHPYAIWPLNGGQTPLVYPELKGLPVADAKVITDLPPAQEDVLVGVDPVLTELVGPQVSADLCPDFGRGSLACHVLYL